MSKININNNVEESVVDNVVESVVDNVVESVVDNVVESVVDNVVEKVNVSGEVKETVIDTVTETVDSVKNGDNAEEIVGNVVETIVEKVVPVTKQKVSFVVDVESKAIVESIADTLDNFSVDKLMDVLPRLIAHVQNYKNLTGPEKRSLVIRMLNHIIDITDCPGDDDIWDPIVKRLVPSLIDTLIKVENKQLKMRKKPKFSFLCCIPK